MPPKRKRHTRVKRPARPPKPTASDLHDLKRTQSRAEDGALIRRALRGDQRSFEKLRQKYHESIYNLIYRMIREKEEVEDLTQEAFIKAFTSLSSFNEEYAFSTWLYKIATNNCIDYIRRRKLQKFSIDKPIESKDSDFTFELPDSTYTPDREIIDKQRKSMLEEAINALPPKYRKVIRMRHTEEREYQEIADLLGLPLGTVKAHIFRARELLYKYLKDRLRHY
ncbi:MAG: sigma-70 family RNA polymerase sigma factor [Proteobacteria bacterium]|nr:sigma-70 family RNA polymerase sigma factor [Pseudomonadota bacterium]